MFKSPFVLTIDGEFPQVFSHRNNPRVHHVKNDVQRRRIWSRSSRGLTWQLRSNLRAHLDAVRCVAWRSPTTSWKGIEMGIEWWFKSDFKGFYGSLMESNGIDPSLNDDTWGFPSMGDLKGEFMGITMVWRWYIERVNGMIIHYIWGFPSMGVP